MFTKVDLEAKVEIGSQIIHPIIDLSVGIGIEIEGITITGIIIGPTIGIDPGTTLGITLEEVTIDQMIDRTIIDKTIGEIITDRTIEETIEIDKSLEHDCQQRYRNRSESRDRQRTYSSDNSRSRDRNSDGQMQQRARTLSDDRGRSRSRSRSNSRVSANRDQLRCYRCGEYDHLPKTAQTPQQMMKWDIVT